MKTVLRLATLSLLFAGSAFALTGERMPEMTLEQMTPAQRTIAEAIMSGPRGRMSGPFNAWLRNPILADRLQKVGEYVRFNTSLDKRINEMAILMTAQAWGAQYEWYAHAPLALKAGLDSADIKAIRERRAPREPRTAALSAYARSLIEQRGHVGDAAVGALLAAGFKPDQALEALAVSAASTITNYALSIAEPPLEPVFQEHTWRPDTAALLTV